MRISLIAALVLLSSSPTFCQVSISIPKQPTDPVVSTETPAPSPVPTVVTDDAAAAEASTSTNSPTSTPFNEDEGTVIGVARTNAQLSSFVSALDEVGMSLPLSESEGPFTIFAPSNDAFATAPAVVNGWLQDPASWRPQIRDLLRYHVVGGEELLSTELAQLPVGMELYTRQGSSITLTSVDPLTVEDVAVAETNILASNGVIHVLDNGLLLPASAQQSLVDQLRAVPYFSTLVRYLSQTNLLESLEGQGPFTIMAPTNEAFRKVGAATLAAWEEDPERLVNRLLFHVAPGNWLEADMPDEIPRLNNATEIMELEPILVGDILASNGVIHTIEIILPLPDTLAPTAAPDPTSLVGILRGRGEFDMFLDALDKTGRLEEFITNGPENPFTFFAVPDAAFVQGLPEKFMDDKWRTHLVNVLTYHIVRGNLFSENLVQVGQQLPTLNFNSLEVSGVGDNMSVQGVGVVERDIIADNGVIHIVNALILPPSATEYAMEMYALFPEFVSFVERIEAVNLTETFNGEGPMTMISPVDGAIANAPLQYPELLAFDNLDAWREVILYHIIPGSLLEFAVFAQQAAERELEFQREQAALAETAMVDEDLLEYEDVMNTTKSNQTIFNVTLPPFSFEVMTMQGSNLTITIDPNGINDADVLFEDLLVKNGIVQVVDTVLIPPNLEEVLMGISDTSSPSLGDATFSPSDESPFDAWSSSASDTSAPAPVPVETSSISRAYLDP